MPRYLVQRSFPEGLSIPQTAEGSKALMGVVEENAKDGVTWVTSYVNPERTQTFCIYDAPDPEAIRRSAQRTKLPVGQITQVSVLDPYFYRAS